ncbi:MAG: hypothetical protein IJ363_05185 [Clostridia bacterium]|nr:hypothetical protein [Clostridia bacterium]
MKHLAKYAAVLLLCVLALLAFTACGPKDYEKQKAAYNDIIEQYTALLTAKQNGEELPEPDTKGMDEREAAIAEAIYTVAELCKSPDIMGYAYKDTDGDGSPELYLMTAGTYVRALFSLDGGKPILLWVQETATHSMAFGRKGYLYYASYTTQDGVEERTYHHARVAGAELVDDLVIGYTVDPDDNTADGHFKIENGTRTAIGRDEFRFLYNYYGELEAVGGQEVAKWYAPRVTPVFPPETDENTPVADFSDYTAVKSTFAAMLDTVATMSAFDWDLGKCDHAFICKSDKDFDTYIHLLYHACELRPDDGVGDPAAIRAHYGYCETDLNGDGADELILLTNSHQLLAIFTTVDGEVVPAEGFMDFLFNGVLMGTDGEGRFLGEFTDDYWLEGRLEYGVFTVTTEGDFATAYTLRPDWVQGRGDVFYKIEGGVETEITQDEYDALRATFGKPADKGITFTPLT